ncbi:unnamed protein product [Symbiodinium sp. CCMP2456]|nr:unnamed protein product [Symbiodinium sp. CCMP2456]
MHATAVSAHGWKCGNRLPICAGLHDMLPREFCTSTVETALASFGQAPFNCAGTTCGGTISQDHNVTTTTTANVVGAGVHGTGGTGAETIQMSVQTWEDCCSYCNQDVCCGFVLISDGVFYQNSGPLVT